MMKKLLGIVLSVLMALPFGGAFAQSTQEEQPATEYITGTVKALQDDGSILLAQFSGDEVLVHVDENTRVTLDWPLSPGYVILVAYNGIMTRSLPPQITAVEIGSYTIEGKVQAVNEESNRLLVLSAEHAEVWVTLAETESAADYADEYVQVSFSGILALSLPPQAYAIGIRPIAAERGTIAEMTDESLLLIWNESGLRVMLSDATKRPDDLAVGDTVMVLYSGAMTRSLPPQVSAIAVEHAAE